MVARHSLRLVLVCENDLVQATQIIRSTDEPITFDAGLDSGVMLNIDDFRRLASAARHSGAALTFTSDDPLRRELARIAGIAVETSDPASSGVRRALESANAATRKIEPAEAAQHIGPPPLREPVPTLTEALNDYTNHGESESWASFSFVITPPVPRRDDKPADDRRYDSSSYPVRSHARSYRGSRRVGKVAAFASVAAVALILASALVLLTLIAPQADVTLIPETQAIDAEITYGIAGTGESYDVAIEPKRITTTLSYSATIPTTGVRTEPDGTATGTILMTNPSTSEITVAAGTAINSPDGATFTTTEDVVIPAADPFGTLTMGSASIGITAASPGPESNVDAGVLNGQLENGLFYTNRDAISGGTTREIATVAQADVESLRAQAAATFAERASDQIQEEIPDGYRPLAGSGQTDDPGFSYSHDVGEDASELKIDSTMRVSALAYDPEALHEMARTELSERLSGSVPADTVLLADTMVVGEPAEIQNSNGNPEYRISANAQARAVLDPDTIADMKQDLVGASEADALRRVAAIEGVSQFELDYGPDWFPLNWPPRLESRIAINIDDSPSTQTATGETRP